VSLSEAIDTAIALLRRDASATILSRREALAIERLLTDARMTLEQISRGVIRREGRSR
jgi:hypothetical protein